MFLQDTTKKSCFDTGGWGCCSQTKWRFRDQTKISTVKKKQQFLHMKQNTKGLGCFSVWVAVAIAVSLLDVYVELVLLVTAHVGVAHEVQGVVVNAHCWCHKVQFHLWSRDRWVLCTVLQIFSVMSSSKSPTFAFCCSVSLLMEMRLLDLGSPITTHQPSSRFCDKETFVSQNNNEDFNKLYPDI